MKLPEVLDLDASPAHYPRRVVSEIFAQLERRVSRSVVHAGAGMAFTVGYVHAEVEDALGG